MPRTKAIVRGINAPCFVVAPGQRTRNKNILNKRNARFKIKALLLQQKQIEVQKKSQVVRNMIVKRVIHYFNGNERLRVTNGLDFERHDIYSDVDLFTQLSDSRKALNLRNWVRVDRPSQLRRDLFYHLFLIFNPNDIRVREGIILMFILF